MEETEHDEEETLLDQDPRAMELLGHYANAAEEGWLTRKDCSEAPPGPRTWNRLHGWLVAKGFLEPGLSGDDSQEIPRPGYRLTRTGRQEIAKRAS